MEAFSNNVVDTLPKNVSEPQEQASQRYALVRLTQGQPAFRSALMLVYKSKCAISGCDVTQVLEAAHITQYANGGLNTPSNGILLRADLHTLFDLDLIMICPDTLSVRFDQSLEKSEYWTFNSQKLAIPKSPEHTPDVAALRGRWYE